MELYELFQDMIFTIQITWHLQVTKSLCSKFTWNLNGSILPVIQETRLFYGDNRWCGRKYKCYSIQRRGGELSTSRISCKLLVDPNIFGWANPRYLRVRREYRQMDQSEPKQVGRLRKLAWLEWKVPVREELEIEMLIHLRLDLAVDKRKISW